MKKFKANKKKPFQINVQKIVKTLTRLELKSNNDELCVIFDDYIDVGKNENDLIIIIYGVCTFEITCTCAFYEKTKRLLLIFYKDCIQVLKFNNAGFIFSSNLINIPFESYDGFTIYADSLALLKNNEIVLISRRIK